MISLKLKDILCENSKMDLTYLISFSNGANVKSVIGLFILLLKFPVNFTIFLEAELMGYACLLNRLRI